MNEVLVARVWKTHAIRRQTPAAKRKVIVRYAFKDSYRTKDELDMMLRMVQEGSGNMTTFGTGAAQLVRVAAPAFEFANAEFVRKVYRYVTKVWGPEQNLERTVAVMREDYGDAYKEMEQCVAGVVQWRQNVDGIYQQYQVGAALRHYATFSRKCPILPTSFRADFATNIKTTKLFVQALCGTFPGNLTQAGSLCEYVCVLFCRIQTLKKIPVKIFFAKGVDLTVVKMNTGASWKHLTAVRRVYQGIRDYIQNLKNGQRMVENSSACRVNKRQRKVQDVSIVRYSQVRDDFEAWLTNEKRVETLHTMAACPLFALSSSRSLWPIFHLVVWNYVHGRGVAEEPVRGALILKRLKGGQ